VEADSFDTGQVRASIVALETQKQGLEERLAVVAAGKGDRLTQAELKERVELVEERIREERAKLGETVEPKAKAKRRGRADDADGAAG